MCSQDREMFSGFFRSFWTSFVHDSILTDGQSIMTWTFSAVSFVSSLIIFAAFSASKRFRFLWSSISFGVDSSMWCLYRSSIFSFISPRFFGVRSFESFAPQDEIVFSSDGSIIIPARIIGPRTGPRPASSIPRSNVI